MRTQLGLPAVTSSWEALPGWSLIRRLFFNTILARENLNQKANFVQGTLKLHNFLHLFY